MAKEKVALEWEQLEDEGETSRNYEHFCVYRDMGQKRTLGAACLKICPKDPENPRKQDVVGSVASISKKFRWKQRAIAWDNELDRQRRATQIVEIRKMEERHVSIALQMQDKAIRAMAALDISEMGPSHILNYLEAAIEIERKSRGVKEQIEITTLNNDPADRLIAEEQSMSSLQLILSVLAERGALPKQIMDMLPPPEDHVDVELIESSDERKDTTDSTVH